MEYKRLISQVTTLVCARCGSAVKVDNSCETDIIVFNYSNNKRYDEYNSLIFNCPHCLTTYDLPCKIKRF